MGNPKQLITKDFAIELNQNYLNSRSTIIRDALGGQDADAVWYSLEELENYLEYVKSEAKAKNYQVDGIRLYLGAYPEKTTYGASSGKTTIFLTPTGWADDVDLAARGEQSPDISEIQPMNFGGVGNPPTLEYPIN